MPTQRSLLLDLPSGLAASISASADPLADTWFLFGPKRASAGLRSTLALGHFAGDGDCRVSIGEAPPGTLELIADARRRAV
jgi:hypothetical protein